MGRKKKSTLQTGLPKSPPALHDPCSGGTVTVVCQFNLVGGEAVICQLVLPVKSIDIYIVLSQSHQSKEQQISVQAPLSLKAHLWPQQLDDLAHGLIDITLLNAPHKTLQ